MIASALARKRLAAEPGREPCIACGGSATATSGAECAACRGTGSTQTGASEAPSAGVVQHSSESVEHYTPGLIVNASRLVLGEIDLDPASSSLANETIKAAAFYGPGSEFGEDGLAEPWLGRVFCNPPGGDAEPGMPTRSNAALWWLVLAEAWRTGEVDAAIFVGFTLEILRSTQGLDTLQPLDFPFCVPSSRIAFDTTNRKITKGKRAGELIDPSQPVGARVAQTQPGHANVIVYLPPMQTRTTKAIRENLRTYAEVDAFVDAFTPIGKCRT